jgi:hypothetical protein
LGVNEERNCPELPIRDTGVRPFTPLTEERRYNGDHRDPEH